MASAGSSDGSGQLVEVFVQGVLDGARLTALRDRLDALCDGAPNAATPFEYIERVYNSGVFRCRVACARRGLWGKGREGENVPLGGTAGHCSCGQKRRFAAMQAKQRA